MNLRRWCLVLLLGATAALGSRLSFQEPAAVQESLGRMPARFQGEWLQKRGLDVSRYMQYHRPKSTGLRLVGKWGRGPSNEVTGRGTLVALTLGSEVALLDFAKPDSPVVLSEIQLNFIPRQTALHDSFLLTCGNGIEIWSIADSTQPVYRNVIPYGVGDFAVCDTFLYFGSWGTFYSYSIANTANPRLLGTCQDSGYVTAATAAVAVVRELNNVLGFIDVSNPAAPTRVGTYPLLALGADARGNICIANGYRNGDPDELWVDVLDISNPANPRLLGEADSVGGYDIHLSGPLAFASGFYYGFGFAILDISDSTRPHVVSQFMTPGNQFAVWADWTSNWAYVAEDLVGLAVVDISNINSPRYDTTVMVAGEAQDIWLDQGRAYVAGGAAGLRILDVSNPAAPADLGGVDTLQCVTFSAAGRDSFVFMGWPQPPPLKVIDVSDPTRPTKAGSCALFGWPRDMVHRDSFLYVAEANRFQVVNVARPRQPMLVGSCVTGDLHEAGLWLQGDLAYFAGAYDGLYILNISDPHNPVVVRVLSGVSAWGCCVRDSLLLVSEFDDSLHIWSIANLSNVHELGADYISGAGHDVQVMGDYAFVGADGLGLVDISDVRDPRLLADYATPDFVRRVVCDSPYVYAASWSAGVCIFETTQVGIQEPGPRAERANAVPTVMRAAGWNRLVDDGGVVFDAMGRTVTQAKPGVYFVRRPKTEDGRPAAAVQKVVVTE